MNFIVRVPAISKELYQCVQSQVGWFQNKNNLLEWDISKGAWVEENQIIAHYNVKDTYTLSGATRKAEILAPFSGQIMAIQQRDCTEWKKSDGSLKKGNDFTSEDILFAIKPAGEYAKYGRDYLEDHTLYPTYINLAIFTETAKISSDGGTVVFGKPRIEVID